MDNDGVHARPKIHQKEVNQKLPDGAFHGFKEERAWVNLSIFLIAIRICDLGNGSQFRNEIMNNEANIYKYIFLNKQQINK